MKLLQLFVLFATLACLGGCATKPAVYHAPNSDAVRAASAQYTVSVNMARTAHTEASNEVRAAKASATREAGLIAATKVDLTSLLHAAPPELVPLVEQARAKVNAVESAQGETTAHINAADNKNEAAESHFLQSDSDKALLSKVSPEYFAKVDLLAEDASRESVEKAGWKKESDKRGNLMGLACGLALAAISTHFMLIALPYSYGLPLIAFPVGYFAARLLT